MARNAPKKSRLLVMLSVSAAVAVVLSLLLASRSGDTHSTGAGCPVEALSCAPGQYDPVDSASPAGRTGEQTTDQAAEQGGDAKAPGIDRARPSPAPTTGTPPTASATTSPAAAGRAPRPPPAASPTPVPPAPGCPSPSTRPAT